jgi:glucose-6-phosphate dehydrogenase assembly protein OpcA
LFRRLSAVSDRVLFDTSTWLQPEKHLARLSQLIADQPRTGFGDLSWTRLGLWRRLMAESFDEPRCCGALERIRRIEIIHGCGPGARVRALLLGGWVAGQLRWSPADAAARVRLSCREDDDATSVGIIAFTLAGDDIEVSVRKNHGERTATAVVTMPDACGLPRKRAFWPLDDASRLSQELDRTSPHKVYERALALAAELASGR